MRNNPAGVVAAVVGVVAEQQRPDVRPAALWIRPADDDELLDIDGTNSNYGFGQIATLIGVTGLTDEATLLTNGHLVAA
jgi:hypothetical protein